MNVIQKRRKRTAKQNQECLDFIRMNPIDVNQPAGDQNEFSFATRATRGNSTAKESSVYFSITSGRGYAHGEVGIAYIDIESPTLKLIQLSDDPWYSGLLTKINIIDPREIIVPDTIYDAKPETNDGKLLKYIRDAFPKLYIVKVPRRHFNDANGVDLIGKYGSDKYSSVKEDVATKYYAMAAASGLLKYLQFVHNIFFKENSLKLDFETKYAHMQIDIDTSYQLELLPQNNPNTVKSTYPSLFDVLDHCVTSFGKRTLRARILEPMCDIDGINGIHDCIAELNQQEFMEFDSMLTDVLRNFNHVERLHKLALVVLQDNNIKAAEILINQALHLKKCLQLVPQLRNKLSPLMCQKFQEIHANLMDIRYETILQHIDSFISSNHSEFHCDSSSKLFQHINCVKNGVNDLIDMLRKNYHELIGQIEVLVGEMSSKHGQAFKLNYTEKRGFHLLLLIANHAVTLNFPPEIEVLETKRNTCYLTTPDINKFNIRTRDIIEEITIQTNVVIASMLGDVVKDIDAIYDLSAFTATLDIILSFAKVSANQGFVCPTFGDEMRIVNAVHPLIEQNIHRTVPTPNNIIATPEYNFFIITGPNMSGKTVYIKTIAVLQIMAQLGCYVPAQSAQFRVTDRILSRIGFNDSIEKNLSTFMLEMNNMEHILKNITPNSLVIIDELCRSTNPKEGVELAWNLCEHLARIRGLSNDGKYFLKDEKNVPIETQPTDNCDTPSEAIESIAGKTTTATRTTSNWKNEKLTMVTSPFIFLTTHFHRLTKLPDLFWNIVNLSFSAEQITNDDNQQTLLYNHRIQEGVTTTFNYGLAVAKTVRLPPEIVDQAFELSHEFLTGSDAQSTRANRSKRKLSSVARQIVRMNRSMHIDKVSDMASIVSAVIGLPKKRSRRRRLAIVQSNSTVSTSVYEEQMKIDRILYNCYGDMMSIVRSTEMDWNERSKDDENCDFTLEEAQIEAVEGFLVEFCEEQSANLIEAIGKLDLTEKSNETTTTAAAAATAAVVAAPSLPPNDDHGAEDRINNAEDNSIETVHRNLSPPRSVLIDQIRTDDNDSDKSSIISIQHISPPSPFLRPMASVFAMPRPTKTPTPRVPLNTGSNRSSEKSTRESGSLSSRSNSHVLERNLTSWTNQTFDSFYSQSRSQTQMTSNRHNFNTFDNETAPKSIGRDLCSFNSFSVIEEPSNANGQNDSFFTKPAQNVGFINSNINSNFDGFDNYSAASQSQNDSFTSFGHTQRKYFSQQEEEEEVNDNDDFDLNFDDDFEHSSRQISIPTFTMETFSTEPTHLMTSRSLANFASQSNFDHIVESCPNLSFVGLDDKVDDASSQFKGSDHTESSSGSGKTKPIRKLPLIQKLKNKSSIFGNTAKLFKNQSVSLSRLIPTKPPLINQLEARATDTNRFVAIKRLEMINAAKNINANESTQANTSDQPISDSTDNSIESIVSPPAEFK